MKVNVQKHKKLIVIIISLILIAELMLISLQFNKSEIVASENDERIAAEISNMTGITVEEILNIKNLGFSWNEVIESLQKRTDEKIDLEKLKRSQLLAQSGLDQEYIEQLKNDGFTDEEIMDARMLGERVIFQLTEITDNPNQNINTPEIKVEIETKQEEDTLESYKKVAESFDLKVAVSLMLRLKSEFGSIENVLDEYLFALQIELNLEDYLIDKEKYLKDKADKSVGILQEKIITLAKIEEKMLATLQMQNENNREDTTTNETVKLDIENNNLKKNPLPEVPMPEVKKVNPINPTEQLLQEIEALNPNTNTN